ncbi:MAG TPA: glycosyltransferase [Bacteroidota bacterium]|nr:glycosyltransferase [Bacteroidota bacterium]
MALEEKVLKVFYVALKHDYGNPQRGFSFEHANFFHTLSHMKGIHLIPFFFDEVLRTLGREEMNRRLVEAVTQEKPHLCFFTIFTDEIKKETLRTLAERTGVQTVNWFTDDHWRFKGFSRFWAPFFTWVVTTDENAVSEYRRIGCSNVLFLQWACNHFLYQPKKIHSDLDVTFIGQVHSTRRKTIEHLKSAGLDVQCWGRGWKNGRLEVDAMIEIFSRSKINLNFSESSVQSILKPVAKVFLKRRVDGSIRVNGPKEMAGAAQVLFNQRRPQIKGRNFEVPGSGGFLLTPMADRLEEYYRLGEEIAVFGGTSDLIEKIRYYLDHGQERERIRKAGYERTLRDHTFEQRFRQLFRGMGVTA